MTEWVKNKKVAATNLQDLLGKLGDKQLVAYIDRSHKMDLESNIISASTV